MSDANINSANLINSKYDFNMPYGLLQENFEKNDDPKEKDSLLMEIKMGSRGRYITENML